MHVMDKLAELLQAISDATHWANVAKNCSSDEKDWEAVNKCGRAKDKARHIIESILAGIET